MWKILPMLLFAVFALLGYRACNYAPDPRKAPTDATPYTQSSFVPSFNSTTMAKDAAARTMAALGGLTADSSAEDLVKALNLDIIDFPPGSSAIPADQVEVLKKSAEAIKAAPVGTRIGIGVHMDNQGEPAGNLKLSQLRADTVKEFLVKQGVSADILASKGYGDTRPIANNDTAEGRFKNCRIEFSIVK